MCTSKKKTVKLIDLMHGEKFTWAGRTWTSFGRANGQNIIKCYTDECSDGFFYLPKTLDVEVKVPKKWVEVYVRDVDQGETFLFNEAEWVRYGHNDKYILAESENSAQLIGFPLGALVKVYR